MFGIVVSIYDDVRETVCVKRMKVDLTPAENEVQGAGRVAGSAHWNGSRAKLNVGCVPSKTYRVAEPAGGSFAAVGGA
jgi:hypothetical protein